MSRALVGQWCWDRVTLVEVVAAWRGATREGQWRRLRERRVRRQRQEAEAEARRLEFARLVQEGWATIWSNAQTDLDVLAWEHWRYCEVRGGWAEWERMWGERYAHAWPWWA